MNRSYSKLVLNRLSFKQIKIKLYYRNIFQIKLLLRIIFYINSSTQNIKYNIKIAKFNACYVLSD